MARRTHKTLAGEIELDHRAGCRGDRLVNDRVRGAYCPVCRVGEMSSTSSPSRNFRAERAIGITSATSRAARSRARRNPRALRRIERAFGIDAAVRFATGRSDVLQGVEPKSPRPRGG
ncbi:MAG TPA: hypothetical protein VGR26_06735, partial [Acidimicrobiales bacterium]|nr:hypothetical protein [Acidimicrobiales bacterium]